MDVRLRAPNSSNCVLTKIASGTIFPRVTYCSLSRPGVGMKTHRSHSPVYTIGVFIKRAICTSFHFRSRLTDSRSVARLRREDSLVKLTRNAIARCRHHCFGLIHWFTCLIKINVNTVCRLLISKFSNIISVYIIKSEK